MSTSMSPTQIPLPADLPTPWEQPEDAQRFWTTDRMHFPGSLTQLDTVLTNLVYNTGLNHGFTTYDLPVHAAGRRFWAHAYWSIAPRMLPDDELEAMGQRSEAKLQAMMGRQLEQWETVWLPELKQLIGDLERFDLPAASLSDLLDHLDVTLRHFERAWRLHFEIVPPAQLSVSLFDEFYREVFGSEHALAAYELVQGFDNLIVRAGAELWKLSRTARASSDVRAILETRAASDVVAALAASEDGRVFLAALQAYLDVYGQRGGTWGLSYASWIEDPTPVIKNLKDYITQPDTADPDLMLAGLAAQREQSLAAARERLQTYPEAVRGQFEFLLKAAQEGNVLSEDHNYWIDFRAAYQVRRVFMEFGRRLAAAGVIQHADDIVHLTVDELRATATQLPNLDQRARVQERQAELARYASVELPPAIGAQPPGPPPVNPFTTMNGKFFGVPPQPSDDPLVLNGAAGSPGVVRGPARVVRSLAEAGRLQAGDILVAETTAPPWTPLFATVAAVVTDTGGALSHCAVVAREYRIPAVVGTGMGTARIAEGQLIEVDGDRGVVRILQAG